MLRFKINEDVSDINGWTYTTKTGLANENDPSILDGAWKIPPVTNAD